MPRNWIWVKFALTLPISRREMMRSSSSPSKHSDQTVVVSPSCIRIVQWNTSPSKGFRLIRWPSLQLEGNPSPMHQLRWLLQRTAEVNPFWFPCASSISETHRWILLKDLMKADLATQDAMVVEFTIYRNEVESWDEVKSPMVYLGLKIAETKTVKILSTWAVKSYSEHRKPIEHSKATYVHGYLRVLEAAADPLLARSGWFGIYLVPKNSQKNPHEAYSIVPVPRDKNEERFRTIESPAKSQDSYQLAWTLLNKVIWGTTGFDC